VFSAACCTLKSGRRPNSGGGVKIELLTGHRVERVDNAHREAALHTPQSTMVSKAKVEATVLIMERWLLWRLRNQIFYALAELNSAIRTLLVKINDDRPIRRLGVTRRPF
jgi:hypothetical protein